MSGILGIMRGHHGILTVESMLNRGTTITVYFPALPNLSEATIQEEVPALTAHAKGETKQGSEKDKPLILIVDDEEALRNMTGLMLQDMGYDLMYAEDGEEAVAVYREHQESIDAVVLDMTMPRMSGEQCLKKLREIRPDVRVLLVSGYHEVEFKGLGEFLGKPFRLADLREKVSSLLQ